MKKSFLLSTMTLLAVSLLAADSSPKDEITAATKKLADKSNYSWKATTVVPEDAQFKPGPSEGKTEKDGFTFIKMALFGDNSLELAMKGDKVAVNTPDGGWQAPSELENAEGPGRFIAGMARNLKTPADQAKQIISSVKELKKDGEAYASDLTEEGAKALLSRGGVTVTNPKASIKFWVKDGVLSKYELKLKGTMSFNGNEFDSDRTTTTEIKDIGTTKVEVPAEAIKKLEPAAAH